MSCFTVASLDSAEKELSIYVAGGIAFGDILIDTGFFTGAHLIAAGIGTGNYKYTCPVYAAAREVSFLFNNKQQRLLTVKQPTIDPELFFFEEKDIITFSVPSFVSVSDPHMDIIRSKGGFTGIHTYHGEDGRMDADHVVWISGPDDTKMAKKFGVNAYKKRDSLFGKIYDLAAAIDPVQMANPMYPGEDGLNYIKRGNQNAYHQ